MTPSLQGTPPYRFLMLLLPAVLLFSPAVASAVEANRIAEEALVSSTTYTNPFLEVELDAIVTQPDGTELRVPGFWAGGNDWRFRYASDQLGTHTWQTECSDAANTGLHGVSGSIEVVASTSTNPLFLHGPIRVASDQRHFEHADGTPFLWLGDTWWKGLCKRLTWEGFQQLTADRAAKGFNVVQIVCGTYPDEPGLLAPGWENEGGKPYEVTDFSVMNPAYFPYADRRFEHLMEAGIVPAIVSGWGRAVGLNAVGIDGYKRHFRNLIARYGAYPVVWILGGETDSGQGPWYELAEYVSATDPYGRMLINHSSHGRGALADHVAFDSDMLVVGHGSWGTANTTIGQVTSSRAQSPAKPVLNGEACYERHMELNFEDLQRHLFWGCLLSGAAGHTYGAAGIWHMGVEEEPGNWGYSGGQPYDLTTWEEGMQFGGAAELGRSKALLEGYEWWRFEPHPEWTSFGFAAGVPDGDRFIYIPNRGTYNWSGITVSGLLSGVPYTASWFDPARDRSYDLGMVTTSSGSWNTPNVPSPRDWVLVMQAPDLGDPVIEPDATAGQQYSGQLLPVGATFAVQGGPAWLTINPDGSFSGTPGESDAGINTWIVSATEDGGPATLIQLEITVIGSTGVLFAEDFNNYSGNQNNTQVDTGLEIAFSGTVAGWANAGAGTMHAVDLANLGGQSNPSDWAVMIWQDNVITSPVIAANNTGTDYEITFDYGTGVYGQAGQETGAGDRLLVEVLRADNSVLASDTFTPGAWGAGNQNLEAGLQGALSYTGDGTGAVRLRIGPQGSLATGRFQGSIDNILVGEAAAAEPGAFRIKQFDVDPIADEIFLSWESEHGLQYALLSDTDLANPIATWSIYDGHEDIAATPPENALLLSPIPEGGRRFFSVQAEPDTE